jgi:hypothetical protein
MTRSGHRVPIVEYLMRGRLALVPVVGGRPTR